MAERLYLSVDQTMRGERALIVQTLNELAGALQSEVNKRSARPKVKKTPIDPSGFLTTCSAQLAALARLFEDSEAEFQRAVAPDGSPQMYVEAYAGVLDRLASAGDTINGLDAPKGFHRTHQALLGLIQSMYGQVSGWPRKMRDAAKRVDGNEYTLRLEIDTNATPLQRALAADSSAWSPSG